ncbi:uncharacterized protein LAESUDRAFT_755484 [Laetiporus sulphureus 93-53]|uniref:Uncharacterized protein n=1 Tax=Laetiporus sulphureus 93-53 TaxID=1314785 RepID=A0A165GU97_9APHY|nr:uncharacterized protein LAESUDRAFT_755484 [Laetiporus sulphureus 93-53]KZT10820.1 hypothetical protein LAESUDRAFT_755484 [Laetiporus sulphureus 93-53]
MSRRSRLLRAQADLQEGSRYALGDPPAVVLGPIRGAGEGPDDDVLPLDLDATCGPEIDLMERRDRSTIVSPRKLIAVVIDSIVLAVEQMAQMAQQTRAVVSWIWGSRLALIE